MVATRSDREVVAFVTGKDKIDPLTIRVEQWVEIIRAAVDELPINYMRGLKSIRQIIQYNDSFGVHQLVNTASHLWLKALKHIRPNQVFLSCAESGDCIPLGSYPHDSWPRAPRVPETNELLPISNGYFILSREKKFYYVLVRWLPQEQWDDKSMSSTPANFWYQADVASMTVDEVDDRKLELLLAADEDRTIAQTMLHRFHLALVETINDARGQYDHILGSKEVIGGYLDRIGQLAH